MNAPPGGVWDLLVIGGGSAGLVGARTAAALGASVALVERARTGGDCLWTGCVPSKALLAAAAAAADARSAGRFGVHVEGVRVDFAGVMAHVRAAISAIEPVDSADALRAAGVTVVSGSARFTGLRTADVDGTPVRFRQALVATGSAPALPPIPGAGGALTSDTVWDLTALPARLVVLGGGTIGCELGQAFARLGSSVTIVEAAGRLLAAEDADASRLVTEALRRDGVTVLTGAPATEVCDGHVVLRDGRRVPADAVLVAVGRRPDTRDLDPGAAGIDLDARGCVVVDAALRTSNPRVWAAGDVTGHPRFTHVAGVHGSTAAVNAVLGLRRHAQVAAIPRVTFTAPEVAAVGAGAPGPGGRTRTVEHHDLDRAVTEGASDGFTRLVLDRRGRVVGATVVGPRAGETLAELTLAVRTGMRAQALAGATHPYPTYGDGPWDAAVADVRARLAAPAARRATGVLAAVRRRWLDRTDGPDPGGDSTFHMHETRPGWVPPQRRDGGVPTTGRMPPVAACRFSTASPAPRYRIPPAGLTLTTRHQGFTRVHPSGLLLTCGPRVERGPSGLNPELRTPPLPATHVRAETGLNTGPGLRHRHHRRSSN